MSVTHDIEKPGTSSGIERAIVGFRRLTHSTALVSVLGFCIADGKPLLAFLAVVLGASSWLLTRSVKAKSLPRGVLNVLVLTVTGYVLVMVTLRMEYISDLTDFLCLVLLIKLFDRGKMRDEAQLLGLSVFVMIGAVLTGAQLGLGVALIVFTPMAIACIVSWQVMSGFEGAMQRRRDAGGAGSGGAGAGGAGAGGASGAGGWGASGADELGGGLIEYRKPLRRIIVTCIALCTVIAVGVFTVTPRNLMAGASAWGRAHGGAVSGFSEQIKLGNAGLLSESPEPVMEVVLADGLGVPVQGGGRTLYLRGAVLENYDPATGTWQSRSDPLRRQDMISGDADEERAIAFDTGEVMPAKERVAELRYQNVVIYNTMANASVPLFAVYRPVAAKFTQSVRSMSFDEQTGLLRRSGDGGRLTYSVLSDMRVPELEPEGTFDRSIVPDQATAIRTLAVTILTEGRSWPEGWQWTNADVERILPTLVAALRARCTYTLEMYAPAAGQDPVEMFLFETKKGHCEYFAAALVRMCQSIGIRARIVTGYAAGEFNPLANRYVVRASDAHAWVEVEIGPGEWVSYDPTPPGELMYARRSGNSIMSRLRQVYEAIEFSWADNIVSFDQGKRKELFGWTPGAVDPDSIRGVRERVTALRRYIRSMLPESPLGVVGVVAGGAALIGGLLIIGRAVYRAVRARRRRGASHRFAAVLSPEMLRATRFYRRAVEALDKVGYRRGPEQGAIEFAERVASARPEAGGLMRGITDDYYGVRYGGQPGSGRGDEQANELIDVLNRKGKA